MVEQFLDQERGGFFLNAKDAERLIVRTKGTYDGGDAVRKLCGGPCAAASCPAHR